MSLKDEIEECGEILGKDTVDSFLVCMQCGKCTGSCPSGRITSYRTRRIINRLQAGDRSVLSDPDLWMCTTCYTCYERCPREVRITDIIRAVRNIAAREGYMSEPHRATASFVIKTGHGVPINDETKKLRKELGLSEVPPTTHKYPEALESIRKIVKKTNFDKMVGFDWDTMSLEKREKK